MGYKTKNIITVYTHREDKAILNKLPLFFPYTYAKEFQEGFHGIIGQLDENQCLHDCEILGQYEKYQVADLDALWERIYAFEDLVQEFSRSFPHKDFVSIDVDCFGGKCLYEGFVVRNGKITCTQTPDTRGHIFLLQKLWPPYENAYFLPFTRDFFKKKGEISGWIHDFSIAGLWLLLKTDFPDTKKYYIDGGQDTLIMRHKERYYVYFESKEDRKIQVSGILYEDTREVILEIEALLQNSFQVFSHQIDLFLMQDNSRHTFQKS